MCGITRPLCMCDKNYRYDIEWEPLNYGHNGLCPANPLVGKLYTHFGSSLVWFRKIVNLFPSIVSLNSWSFPHISPGQSCKSSPRVEYFDGSISHACYHGYRIHVYTVCMCNVFHPFSYLKHIYFQWFKHLWYNTVNEQIHFNTLYL